MEILIDIGLYSLLGIVIIVLLALIDSETTQISFGKVPEGRAIAIRQGGQHLRFVNRHLGKKTDRITGKITLDTNSHGTSQFTILGRVWLGFPFINEIFSRNMQWNEWQLNKVAKMQEIVPRDEATPFVFTTPFPYAMILDEAEDKGRLPLQIRESIIIEPVDLHLAFYVEDWYQILEQTVLEAGRVVVGTTTFDELRSGVSTTKYIDAIKACSPQLEERIGYRIIDVKINDVSIVGDNQKAILKAQADVVEAKLKKDKTVTDADAEAYRIKKTATATANGNKKIGMAGVGVLNAEYAVITKDEKSVEVTKAKAIEKLSEVTGTLVLGDGTLQTLNLNSKKV